MNLRLKKKESGLAGVEITYIVEVESIYIPHSPSSPLANSFCHGTEAVATERMYSRSLQDVARSIVRVKGVRRVIYLRVANVSCTQGVRESTGLSYRGPCGRVL